MSQAQCQDLSLNTDAQYRIYSINRLGRLLNFWTLRVGAYSNKYGILVFMLTKDLLQF